MDAQAYSETSVSMYQTTRHIAEDRDPGIAWDVWIAACRHINTRHCITAGVYFYRRHFQQFRTYGVGGKMIRELESIWKEAGMA
jgi:hypothetical protein